MKITNSSSDIYEYAALGASSEVSQILPATTVTIPSGKEIYLIKGQGHVSMSRHWVSVIFSLGLCWNRESQLHKWNYHAKFSITEQGGHTISCWIMYMTLRLQNRPE